MAKTKPLYKFPRNVPVALIDAYIKADRSGRKLAQELGVNHYYVSQALRGKEPKSLCIREKLFFPLLKRKPRFRRISEMTTKELSYALDHRQEMKDGYSVWLVMPRRKKAS